MLRVWIPHAQRRTQQCPAYKCACPAGHFTTVCRSKGIRQPTNTAVVITTLRNHICSSKQGTATFQGQPGANAIQVQYQNHSQANHLQLYKVDDTATEAAPTITVHVSSSTGTHYIDVLPDSGADIVAAGQEMLHTLGHHIDNILSSTINPRTVNGSSMVALGKITITIQLGMARYKDELHIYPGVYGELILWKAAKGLGILSSCYLYPAVQSPHTHNEQTIALGTQSHPVESQSINQALITQHPAVFDKQI